MSVTEDARIAVFIDVDNIRSSVESYLDTQLDFDAIMAKINSLGRTLLKRAYADWSMAENRVLRRVLLENGVEPVQVFFTGAKNSADISLAIDCIELLYTHDLVNTIVLVELQHRYFTLTVLAGQDDGCIHCHQDRAAVGAADRMTLVGCLDYVTQIFVGLETAVAGFAPVF